MGFPRTHVVGTGMHVTGPDGFEADIVVKFIKGFRSEREALLELRGSLEGRVLLTHKGPDQYLNSVITVGIASIASGNNVRLYYHAPPEFIFSYRVYNSARTA